MARITKIEPGVGASPLPHTVRDDDVCTYRVIESADGTPLLHLEVSSADGKSSFSMQFDQESAGRLFEIFSDAEVLSRLTLDWQRIDADGFERLIARLLDLSGAYTKINRPMNVNAPDCGRDIEAFLQVTDGLGAETLERLIVQAKHWPGTGINASEIADLVHAKMPQWEGEPVRRLTIATSGSFTRDAVHWAETHNRAAHRPTITLWSSSELERMLRRWPTLAAEFGLITSSSSGSPFTPSWS
ncbi:restriction endonuclease [Nocardia amamiensis]|uniref:Restriction endonuclease n=1 Tax=Nocardia amamiensis TaxID=404578 RepID=A0ABS0CVJ6_9NOCA|nr:restriction endonuclease [Nocardia amamiensis]MBF6300525.1 restriction endonuclease [Nocardia amamiensis]